MFSPLSLKEFYDQTLKQAGLSPREDDLEKYASANKLDPVVVKTAAAIFEQLQLDGVDYPTKQDMLQDAMKIANGYVDHCKEAAAQAEKLAGDLHRVARHAVEGYLAQHSIDLNADEGVKIAGLQASSFQSLTQKQAELRQLDSVAATGDDTKVATFRVHDDLGGSQGQFNADKTIANIGQHFNIPDTAGLAKHIGASVAPEQLPAYADALHAQRLNMPQASFPEVHQATMAADAAKVPPKPSGLMSRPGLMLGAAGLGLGGMYLLNKKREQAKSQAQSQVNAKRQSIIGAASLPGA